MSSAAQGQEGSFGKCSDAEALQRLADSLQADDLIQRGGPFFTGEIGVRSEFSSGYVGLR
jgi:hypothetical protein